MTTLITENKSTPPSSHPRSFLYKTPTSPNSQPSNPTPFPPHPLSSFFPISDPSMAAREPFNVTAKSPMAAQPHSPWHSPVPYLFGGLAAMLGLIAFALLILACSYWRLSGYLEGDGSAERDLEAGEGKTDDDAQKPRPVFEEKILVIMAGDAKPTFLATPMSSRSSSFGDSCSGCGREKNEKAQVPNLQGGGTDVEVPQIENREDRETSADQTH